MSDDPILTELAAMRAEQEQARKERAEILARLETTEARAAAAEAMAKLAIEELRMQQNVVSRLLARMSDGE